MEEMYKRLQAMPRKWLFLVIGVFLIFEAIFVFPLQYELSIFNALLVYIYVELGVALSAITTHNTGKVFLAVALLNLVGLGLRTWLEWGEYSMMRDLTIDNVMLTYCPIVIMIYIGYAYAKYRFEQSGASS